MRARFRPIIYEKRAFDRTFFADAMHDFSEISNILREFDPAIVKPEEYRNWLPYSPTLPDELRIDSEHQTMGESKIPKDQWDEVVKASERDGWEIPESISRWYR